MRVVYQGPHREVELPSLGRLRCKKGESVEVSDEVGLELIKQKCWKSAAPTLGGKVDKPAASKGKE